MKFSEAFYFLYFQLMMGLSGHNPIIGQERSVIPGHLDSLSWNINNMRRRIILSHTRLFRFQLKCSLTEEWIKKMWCIYTMEYYSAIKKNEIMPFAAMWMDSLIHTEGRKPEKEKYHMTSLRWENLNEFSYQPIFWFSPIYNG